MTYEAEVDQLANYISSLPQRAQEAWMDAAYAVFVDQRIAGGRIAQSRVDSSASARLPDTPEPAALR